MVNSLSSFLLLYIIASIVAVALQLYWSTSLVAKGIVFYKNAKNVRFTIHSVLIAILCALLFWFAGEKIIPLAILLAPYYKLLAMAAILFALNSEFHYGISFSKQVVRLFKKIRAFRVSLLILLIGVFFYLFYRITGDRIIYFFLLFTPEYILLTISAIVAFYILNYASSKNEYANLNAFGSVLFIVWFIIFVIGFSVHLGLHFKLFEKGIILFKYLNRVLPGAYKSLPYIILVSWIINFFALIYVTGSRISNILIDYVVEKIRNSYQEKIIELMYDESTDNRSTTGEILYFKKVRRLYFTRQLFADELLRMHEIVYGSLLGRINHLFKSLQLMDDAFKHLHSRHWFYKIKGLRIYAELGDTSQITYIKKLTHSKNYVLRFEAQLALARLSEDERPLNYLKDLKEKLSLWEQLNLIYFYVNHQKPVGDLTGLLESANCSVICFGLLCIRKFNKVDYLTQIMVLTGHEDFNVRNAAFQTLALYDEPEICTYILSCFDQTLVLSNRINLIRSLGQTRDASAIPFLKEQLLTVVSDEICIELFSAFIQIDSKQASDMANSDNSKFMRLYEHVTETLKR